MEMLGFFALNHLPFVAMCQKLLSSTPCNVAPVSQSRGSLRQTRTPERRDSEVGERTQEHRYHRRVACQTVGLTSHGADARHGNATVRRRTKP